MLISYSYLLFNCLPVWFKDVKLKRYFTMAKMPLLCSSKISRQTTKLMSPLRKFHLDSVSEMNVLKLTSSLPTPVSIGVRETDLFRKLGILKKVLHSPITDKNWHLIARIPFSEPCNTLIISILRKQKFCSWLHKKSKYGGGCLTNEGFLWCDDV